MVELGGIYGVANKLKVSRRWLMLNHPDHDIFHLFKIKKLLNREDLEVIEIRSTDFLHLPPTIRKALKIGKYLKVLSDHLEEHGWILRLFGAHIGVVLKKI